MKDLAVQFMTFADYAMVSQDNKFSVIGMFNELRVQQFPGGLASAFLVAIVEGKPDTSYQLTIQGEKQKKTVFPPITLDLRTGIGGTSNITINLNNMAFPEEGDYVFAVMHEKKKIGSTTLKVIRVNKPNAVSEPLKYKLPN